MSAILEATGPTLTANGLVVGWAVPIGAAGSMSPLVMITDKGEDLRHMLSPNDARTLGIALIEASGLAVCAYAERMRGQAEDNEEGQA
jgi:hypothetical protein